MFGGFLKQSTTVDILLGPFLDEDDGKTAETGLTIDVELSKNGQALADSESAVPSHDAAGDIDGYYNCVLGTTDTNTVGQLTVVAHQAGALPVRIDFQVIEEVPFDEMFKNAAAGVQGVIEVNNLDHLMKVAVADRDTLAEVVDDTVLANILTKTDGDTSDFDHATDSLEATRDAVSFAGANEITYTMYTDESGETGAIEGVTVWITTDEAGSNTIWSGTTDVNGVLREEGGSKPFLDAGTYFFWRQKAGFTFTNPDEESFS